jgi:cobalt/nickel transport system permease protein
VEAVPDGVVRRLPAEVKLMASLAFVVAVVLTPPHAVWVFALDTLLAGAVAIAAGVGLRQLLRRMRIELPFVAFAVFLPIVGGAPRIDVLGVSLSSPGLWAGWSIVVKGSLGVLTAIVLSSTTPVSELLAGLRRLRVPPVLVAIAGFMVRYLDVLAGEADRMRMARLARADDPRWLWQARGTAMSAGTLFVRAYERGERVQLAMVARGFTGTMPVLHESATPTSAWLVAAAVPASAALLLVAAWRW